VGIQLFGGSHLFDGRPDLPDTFGREVLEGNLTAVTV
jgi:hypothetical protein